MTLAVDASSIRSGGCLAHLNGVLRHAQPYQYGFDKVFVWCNPVAANYLGLLKNNNMVIVPQMSLSGSFRQLAMWQTFTLPHLIGEIKPDVLWSPGGIFFGRCRVPTVMMSQNLLPFESVEMARYGMTAIRLKFLLLRQVQINVFKKAQKIIFLSKYARDRVLRYIPEIADKAAVIPHGIDAQFFAKPRQPDWGGRKRPIRLLYVSTADYYKHQWNVVKAVELLVRQGYDVVLDLVGSAYPPALKKLQQTIAVSPVSARIHYRGSILHAELAAYYHQGIYLYLRQRVKLFPLLFWKPWPRVSRLPAVIVNRCRKCWEMPAFILIPNIRKK